MVRVTSIIHAISTKQKISFEHRSRWMVVSPMTKLTTEHHGNLKLIVLVYDMYHKGFIIPIYYSQIIFTSDTGNQSITSKF